jgi:hypothetical protein
MRFLICAMLLAAICPLTAADDVTPQFEFNTPVSPPTWALLQRQLLDANVGACEEFFNKYFDEKGFLLCVERWGGDDGPDDAIENCLHWPALHAIGADQKILTMYKKAWEGHLRQYTLAKTKDVPMARDGMYYREFPVSFDWLHNAEGLVVFCLQGLSDPNDAALARRTKRYAGFYMNEDPQAQNFDFKHLIIKSMFNGSRGPTMRKATGLDWAGDPIEIEHRFELGHGERNYSEMVAHFKDYNDIIGDHPQNMLASALPLNAYMLTGEERYKKWVLNYIDAWRKRMIDNDYIIPTNIGLDGKIGGATDGKWYGGCYGWAFSVEVPQTGLLAHRNTHYLGLNGFMNAYLLTGDDKFLDPWRRQIKKVNAQAKMINGKMQYPHMFGDKGWYNFTTAPYSYGVQEIAYLTMQDADLKAAGIANATIAIDANAAEAQLRGDLSQVRSKVLGMRTDKTTPDTRLADDPMKFNPASVSSLVRCMLGGLPTNKQGLVQHARLRYFDPINRRAGIPDDCSALVEQMTADSATVQLINTNQLTARTITIQAGGYAEHTFTGIIVDGKKTASEFTNSRTLTITLGPGCGTTLTFGMKRYSNEPTIHFPWSRR